MEPNVEVVTMQQEAAFNLLSAKNHMAEILAAVRKMPYKPEARWHNVREYSKYILENMRKINAIMGEIERENIVQETPIDPDAPTGF